MNHPTRQTQRSWRCCSHEQTHSKSHRMGGTQIGAAFRPQHRPPKRCPPTVHKTHLPLWIARMQSVRPKREERIESNTESLQTTRLCQKLQEWCHLLHHHLHLGRPLAAAQFFGRVCVEARSSAWQGHDEPLRTMDKAPRSSHHHASPAIITTTGNCQHHQQGVSPGGH